MNLHLTKLTSTVRFCFYWPSQYLTKNLENLPGDNANKKKQVFTFGNRKPENMGV